MIAEKLKNHLHTIPAIADRLSVPEWGVRIRTNRIPQGMPLPYVRLTEITSRPDYHLTGELAGLDAVIQVDVWADTAREADEIAELVRGYDHDGNLVAERPLSGFAGQWDGVRIDAVTITNEIASQEPPTDASDDWLFRRTTDLRIHYHRPVT